MRDPKPHLTLHSKSLTEDLNKNISLTVWQDDHNHRLVMCIPIAFINEATSKPIKWLTYVCRAIVGMPGYVSSQPCNTDNPSEISADAALSEGGEYYYVAGHNCLPTEKILLWAYSLSLMEPKFRSRSLTGFQDFLKRRDGACVFTGLGMVRSHHFVPGRSEDYRDWKSLVCRGIDFGPDDIRNGLTVSLVVHDLIREGVAGILCKTNDILSDADIPSPRTCLCVRDIVYKNNLVSPCIQPPEIKGIQSIADGPPPQYILQYFTRFVSQRLSLEYEVGVPHNTRADFLDLQLLPDPSRCLPDPRICEYSYGGLVLLNFIDSEHTTPWTEICARAHKLNPDFSVEHCPTYSKKAQVMEYLSFFSHCKLWTV
ncbi:hypothetical protein VKT23_004361 [Stygiomarasmius scandens]|uniref:HNH nuclease domain-containing protein n=1 Tax=Marasmiellus scandens TaxID=2682957 RepID=A0ABR1JUS8_9AGAR